MRAYLSVNYGNVVPQDNSTNWRTEVRLFLVNNGHTPAHGVHYKANADVLPNPLPEHFDFPIPNPPETSVSVLGPGQSMIMAANVKHMLSEAGDR